MKIDFLKDLFEFASSLDLQAPASARAHLEERFPFSGADVQSWGDKFIKAIKENMICNKGEFPMQFSRLSKPSSDTFDFSVDVVLMNGAGPNHIHPEGEIDLCFPFDGNPKFDGQEPGWVVYGAGSQHIPTVSGGTMAIVYLLPKGAFELVEG